MDEAGGHPDRTSALPDDLLHTPHPCFLLEATAATRCHTHRHDLSLAGGVSISSQINDRR